MAETKGSQLALELDWVRTEKDLERPLECGLVDLSERLLEYGLVYLMYRMIPCRLLYLMHRMIPCGLL